MFAIWSSEQMSGVEGMYKIFTKLWQTYTTIGRSIVHHQDDHGNAKFGTNVWTNVKFEVQWKIKRGWSVDQCTFTFCRYLIALHSIAIYAITTTFSSYLCTTHLPRILILHGAPGASDHTISKREKEFLNEFRFWTRKIN